MVRHLLPLVCTLALVHSAFGFNPPEDSIYDLSAKIEGVPEVANPDEPLGFKVVLKNGAKDTFYGTLAVWLNDDWEVVGSPACEIMLKPGEGAEFPFQAKALPSVLEAHYPVHAGLFTGGARDRVLVLHPIAIFRTKRPKEAVVEAGEWGIPGGAYTAPLAGKVAVDGELAEWSKVPASPLGTAQCTSGTVEPGSFMAHVQMQHDADYLYLAANVSDNEICSDDVSSRDFVNSDYLRLYFHATEPAQRKEDTMGTTDVMVAINPFGDKGKPLAKVPGLGQPANPKVNVSAWRMASKKTDTGYQVELAVPLAQIGDGLGAGSVLGMNVLIGDSDGNRRRSEVCLGRRVGNYWLNPQSYLSLTLSSDREVRAPVAGLPVLTPLQRRTYRLNDLLNAQWGYTKGDRGETFATNMGGDGLSGASFTRSASTRGGIALEGFGCHPPYRDGLAGGVVWRQYFLELPDVRPVSLEFSTAIRDHNPPKESPSDGVEFRVMLGAPGGEPKQVFSRFSDSKQWEAAEVDLAAYAGKRVVLTLVAGPGPRNSTNCDSAFWGQPVIRIGRPPVPITEEEWAARTKEAVRLARAGASGIPVMGAFPLKGRCGAFGAGVVTGRQGLVDGVIAFAGGGKTVAFRGFKMVVDGETVGSGASGIRCRDAKIDFSRGELSILHMLDTADGNVVARARFTTEQGALRLAFDMPGTNRSPRGTPRFTELSLGGADSDLFRVYLGFGNVIEKPEGFRARASGFVLSARHIGTDYANGMSLVQASDVYPSAALCQPQSNRFSLLVPHDATFTLIPSTDGAFSAARHYRDVNGFKPGKGHAALLGRMCLDQWGGNYEVAAKDLKMAAKYGMNHSIFVKHVWQRWGYDYRLPDIYPPRGGLDTFLAMRDACREGGILFAPHDNYIDFYPDANRYTYDDIIFNRDGTPQRAWFNKGRKAQSYRWLPHAFMPYLERNMRLLRNGVQPTGIFIDVFSAMPPIDYYDRDGRFHTRNRTAREWSKSFDRTREILGGDYPMLSEAGTDALIGSLDGAQSDHYSADRWGANGVAADRTPWHDMGTHGSFVLLAGGLGHRYGNKDGRHTYGTDDYLTNTVMGGRNPMCDGPFSRRAAMTYWLLHDLCDDLARASFETHGFGESVYQQHTTFGDGSNVWVNRGETEWKVQGKTLPKYGFYAKSPKAEAGIVEIGDQRAAFAKADDVLFVDARPPFRSGLIRPLSTRVLEGKYLGDGKFQLKIEWKALEPLEEGIKAFVHIDHDKATNSEGIMHYGGTDFDGAVLTKAGTYQATITGEIPADSPGKGGEYRIRYGLYNPGAGGHRVVPMGNVAKNRARGGKIALKIVDGKIVNGTYAEESEWDHLEGVNSELKMVEFGSVRTNGAFRLMHPTSGDWLLIPLPGSIGFEAEMDLAELGRTATRVVVETVDPTVPDMGSAVSAGIKDGILSIKADSNAFGYRLKLQ